MTGEAPQDRPTHLSRCPWSTGDPLLRDYHDREWGVPVRDERRLLELLVLEGAQAGLSWLTVLRKRGAYREAFLGFDPERIARFGPRDVERLLADSGLIRHRGKIEAAIQNARATLELREAGGLASFVWSFVEGRPVRNRWRRAGEVPAATPLSEAMARALRDRGFAFVGPTVCYSFMQAAGLVDDHLVDCFRHARATGEGPGGSVARVPLS
jgi:DNA-3-methyladenine glycosylase I